ncbi:potassium channel protein [Methylomonas sp. LWB]|uniref:NAD-binding protein n=1 Tax=Methylomonas sp. LWB TaxID=1905845 RepID=UPI0008D8FAA7|nr:NAD-binding protein [Methylomonas sp. LWB]OHX34787.1 potassium channel protein [Methylomonas sp. LWB]
MLSKLIVYAAYFLKSAEGYRRSKQFFYQLLEEPHSPRKRRFDSIMIGLIVLSVIFLLYRIEHQASTMGGYFEQAILAVFITEYLLRGWIYSDSYKIIIEEYEKALYLNLPFNLPAAGKRILAKELEYMSSAFAVIDILAILPSYRPLDILRIFIVFRLFKLFRYSDSAKLFANVLASRRYELTTLLIFSGFLLFIASVAIYMFEYQVASGSIKTMFDAFYWSVVTLATVGYGDITPQTTGGRWVAVFLILTSIGVLSFFTSILIAAFAEKMLSLRESRAYAELDRYQNFIIICGFGRVGQEIARHLHREQQPFIVIDRKEANVVQAKNLGYLAVQNDASKNEVLLNAGINRGATAILCITGDDVVNVYITLTGRHLNKNVRIISRANRHENVNKLYQAGADNVIRPFEVAGLLAAEFVGQPVAFEAISGILQNQTEITMETVLVTENSPLDNRRIGQLDLKQNKLTLLGVISDNPIHFKHKNKYQVKQQHFYFNPEEKFILRHGDLLVLLGRKYGIDHFRDQVEQRRLWNRAAP